MKKIKVILFIFLVTFIPFLSSRYNFLLYEGDYSEFVKGMVKLKAFEKSLSYEDLKKSINIVDCAGKERKFYAVTKEYTFFSGYHEKNHNYYEFETQADMVAITQMLCNEELSNRKVVKITLYYEEKN